VALSRSWSRTAGNAILRWMRRVSDLATRRRRSSYATLRPLSAWRASTLWRTSPTNGPNSANNASMFYALTCDSLGRGLIPPS
jgi:hypothetical protein